METKEKKVVMYFDGIKTIHTDVEKEALKNNVTLKVMKEQLEMRFYKHKIVFKVE